MATSPDRNRQVDYEICTYSIGPTTLDGSPLVAIRRIVVEDFAFVHTEAEAARMIARFEKMDKEQTDV